MKILIADSMHPSLFTMLEAEGWEYAYHPEYKREDIIRELPQFEGLFIRSKTFVDFEVMQQAKKLRFIARAGAGLDLIDLDIAKELSISYKNNPVESLRVVSIKLKNYGFLPIKKDDFQEAIQIQLQGNLKILYYEVKSIVPKNLKIVCAQDLKSIFIEPTLLNSKDTFSVKIVYDGEDAQIEPACRIVGISHIKDLELVRLASRNLVIIGIFSVISIYSLIRWTYFVTEPGYWVQVFGSFMFLVAILYTSIYRDRMIQNL